MKYFIEWFKFESLFGTPLLKTIIKSIKYARKEIYYDIRNWLFDKGLISKKTYNKKNNIIP